MDSKRVVNDGGRLSLISRKGHDRTEAFAPLATAGHELVINGEIAVPDGRGATHLHFRNDATAKSAAHRLV